MTRPIATLLVANRGEIARRIFRTAHDMGIATVAVYSEADRDAPFVREASLAVPIGPSEAARSYLDIDKIIGAARTSGADAIHPGYGFLSENTELAVACEQAGLRFIGPPADAIAAMGSKSAAKALMEQAGVPLVPGYHGEDQQPQAFQEAAGRIGYPLLIKASAGGGGKGMRVVREPSALPDEIAAAQREARSAFGDDRLLLERYLETPRHVEVQVLFDQQGHGVYLFDRDCSVQRRHQKIIEEAPAPGIPDPVRQAMGKAAVRCGKAIDYVGAGTVEFLYDPDSHEFFFMEMNTRLQVEHPVTEMITGLDLVAWQIRVADGEPLPWQQRHLTQQGHAMEARIYAEDADHDFLPQTGVLHTLREPAQSTLVRVDSGVSQGNRVSSWYDPMLAKVIAHGETRDQARRNLLTALKDYQAEGVILNTDFISRVLRHDDFARARLTTGFIDVHRDQLMVPSFQGQIRQGLSLMAWLDTTGALSPVSGHDVWGSLKGFRLGPEAWQSCELDMDNERQQGHYRIADVGKESIRVELKFGQDSSQLMASRVGEGRLSVRIGYQSVQLAHAVRGDQVTVFADSACWTVRVNHPELAQASATTETELTAPMHGRITSLLCQPGDRVTSGQALLTMEAMKMEHTLRAGFDGLVEALHCQAAGHVAAGQVLVTLEKAEE